MTLITNQETEGQGRYFRNEVNVRLFFDDGTEMVCPVSEKVLIEQMNRPRNKRLYVCGIEFSAVNKAEVLK